jgi:hypothetical protein
MEATGHRTGREPRDGCRYCAGRRIKKGMSEQRILELEQQLLTANEAVAKMTLSNAELTKKFVDVERQYTRLKHTSRRDESSFRQQLAVAQGRRF